MAPKKAAAAGPTAQDVEAEWILKEQAWQREEAQLAYFVKLQQDDARILRMRSRELLVDVESLTTRSSFLENKSVELRVQAKKVSRELVEQHARELKAVAAQDVLLSELNSTVQSARADLVTLNSNFEVVVSQNADKVKAVSFRNSGIAGLREKVAKLRNERAHLVAELEDTQRAVVQNYQDPRVAPFQTKPRHCIVVAESTNPSWSFVEQVLMYRYQFDISRLDPAETVLDCTWTARRNYIHAAKSSSRHHWSDESLSSERPSSSLLSVLSYGEPQRRVLVPPSSLAMHRGEGQPTTTSVADFPPSTKILQMLHDVLYSAAREESGEQSVLVCMSATLDTTAATNPLDAICFRCQGNTEGHGTVDDGNDARSASAIVSLRDVLTVVLGAKEKHAGQTSAVAAIELTAADYGERYVVVAGTNADPTILFVPTQRHPSNSAPDEVETKHEEAAAASSSGDVLSGGRTPASSSVLGVQLLRLLEDEARNNGGDMSSHEFCQRLSMRILCSDASVSRRPVPEWLHALSCADAGLTSPAAPSSGGENSDCSTATVLLPKPGPLPPVSSQELQVGLDFFAVDFTRHLGNGAGQKHTQQLSLESYCKEALKSATNHGLLHDGRQYVNLVSCSLVHSIASDLVSGAGGSVPPLPMQPDARRDVFYYVRSNDLSPQQLADDIRSLLSHQYRSVYGVALKTDADRDAVFGALGAGGFPHICVSCVAEGNCRSSSEDPQEHSSAGRWCILRLSAVSAPTIGTALSIPSTLRGSDLQETLQSLSASQRRLPGGTADLSPTTALSIVSLIEEALTVDLAAHNVHVVPVLPAQCVVATSLDAAGMCALFEQHEVRVAATGTPLASPAMIGASMQPHPAPLVHLAHAQFCDALHWRRIGDTAIAQQPLVLIVTSGNGVDGSDDGDGRGPRDRMSAVPLLDSQHHELLQAMSMLSSPHTDVRSSSDQKSAHSMIIPSRILNASLHLHVSLKDLQCSHEERDAILAPPPSTTPLTATGDAVVEGAAVDAPPSPATIAPDVIAKKRRIWRNVMSLFPPSVSQFLTTVSYPCLVISSPATIIGASLQTYHGLVVPRSLATMRSRTQPDCLFRAHDVALAMELYFQHILCTDATDARKGAVALSGLSPSRHTTSGGAAQSSAIHSTSAVDAHGDVADDFPSTWFPV